MAPRRILRAGLAALAASCLFAQPPVVQATGVLNAASILETSQAIAPQMLLAIKGQNLAASIAQWDPTTSDAWPTNLAGTTVTFNGILAPLWYVSPTQINLQVPSAVRGMPTADIVVTTAAGSSNPVTATVAPYSLGIFTQDATGCGPGSVLNIHADGSLALNTTLSSFDPLHDVGMAVFFTGFGSFADRQDGVPWTYNPADNLSAGDIFEIAPLYGVPGIQPNQAFKLLYAGPAPDLVGVDQVNIGLYQPNFLFESCHVPLYLTKFNQSASQMVTISVHNGGGACIEPAPNTLGLVTWQKITVLDTESTTSTEGVQIQFLQGQQLFFPNPPLVDSQGCCTTIPTPPMNCQSALPASLSAGPITVSGVTAAPLTVSPQGASGQVTYQAAFPVGTLTGGTYQIAAAGGNDVGAFSSSAAIAQPVTFTNLPPPGSTLSLPFQITWTGGDSLSAIDLTFLITTAGDVETAEFAARASEGSLDIPADILIGPFPSIPFPNGDIELIITQQPVRGVVGYFNAAGLNQGGAQTWKYVWDIRSLTH